MRPLTICSYDILVEVYDPLLKRAILELHICLVIFCRRNQYLFLPLLPNHLPFLVSKTHTLQNILRIRNRSHEERKKKRLHRVR